MQKYFRPQKDITAYEAEFCLAHIGPGGFGQPIWRRPIEFTAEQWVSLSPEMQRHFADNPD